MEINITPILPELTKTYILERISEEQIMEKYLGIPVNNETLAASSVCSPLRHDKDPTCNYWYSKSGKLRFKDWNGHFNGDCFDVVAFKLSINSKNKQAFQLILHTIAKDFRIHKYIDYKEVSNYNNITKQFFNKQSKVSITRIKIIPRNYTYRDLNYWNKFLIDKTTLEIGRVYAVEEVWISKNNQPFIRIYTYNIKDPAYGYFGGKSLKGDDKWKIYFPFRSKKDRLPRFLSSHSFLQGEHLLRPARFCVVTKAYKDVLSFRKFNIMSVAPSAESVLLTNEEYWLIKQNCDFIVSCMDYDRTGKMMSKQLKKIYGIEPIMLTDGYYNTYNYGSKDPSDYISDNGYNNSLLLFRNVFERFEKDLKIFDKYMYNNLKFIK